MPKNRKNNDDVFKRRRKLLSSGLFSNIREHSDPHDLPSQDLSMEEIMAMKWGEQETYNLLQQFKNVDHDVIYDVLNMCDGDVTRAEFNLKEMIGVTHHKKHPDKEDLATIACGLLSYEAFGNGELVRDLDSSDQSERVTDSSVNESGSIPDTDYFGNTYDYVTDMKETFLFTEAKPRLQLNNYNKQYSFNATPMGFNGDGHSWPIFTSLNPYNDSVGSQSQAFLFKPLAVRNESVDRTKENIIPVASISTQQDRRLASAPVNNLTIMDKLGVDGPLTNGHFNYDEWGEHHCFTHDPETFLKDFTAAHSDKLANVVKIDSSTLELNSIKSKKRNRQSNKKRHRKEEGKNSNENILSVLEPLSTSGFLVSGNKEDIPAEYDIRYGCHLKHLLTDSHQDNLDRSREQLKSTTELLEKHTLFTTLAADKIHRFEMFPQGAELSLTSQNISQQQKPLLSSPGANSTIQSKSPVNDKNLAMNQVSRKSPRKKNTKLQSDQLKIEALPSDQTQFGDHNTLTTFDPIDPLGWNEVFKVHLNQDSQPKRSSVKGQFTDKRQHKSQSKSVPPWAQSPVKESVLKSSVSVLKHHKPSSHTGLKISAGKKSTVKLKLKEEKAVFMDQQVKLEAETCFVKSQEDLVNDRVLKGPPQWMKGFMLNVRSEKQNASPVSNTQTGPPPAQLSDSTSVCKNKLSLHGVRSPVGILRNYIFEKQPVMVILRGLPGSGKSYLASQLTAEAMKMGVQGIVLSTDDYFMQTGAYVFEKTDLSIAHDWNKKRALTYVRESKSPIIIDNTNTCLWEFLPYAELALSYKYDVQIFEPDTEWKFKIMELSRKNSHGVAKEHIKRMKDRYEQVTLDALLKAATESIKKKGIDSKNLPNESVQESGTVTFQESTLQNLLNINQHKVATKLPSTKLIATLPGWVPVQPKSSAPWFPPTDSLLAAGQSLDATSQLGHRADATTVDKSGSWEGGLPKTFSEGCQSKDEQILKAKTKAKVSEEEKADRNPKKITATFFSSALKEAWVNLLKDKDQAGLWAGNFNNTINNPNEFYTCIKGTDMFGKQFNIQNEAPSSLQASKENEMMKPVSITEGALHTTKLATEINGASETESTIDSIDDYPLNIDDVEKGSQLGDSCSTSESFITCCSNEESIVGKYGDETSSRLTQEELLVHSQNKISLPWPLVVDAALISSTEDVLDTPDTVINALQFDTVNADGPKAETGIFASKLDLRNCTDTTSQNFNHEVCCGASPSSSSSSFIQTKSPGSCQGRTNILDTEHSVQKIGLSTPLVSYSDSDEEECSTQLVVDVPQFKLSEECQNKKPTLSVIDKKETLQEEHTGSKENSKSSSRREDGIQIEKVENVSPIKQIKRKKLNKGRKSEPFIADSLKEKSKNESWSCFYKQHTDCLTSSEDPLSSETTNSSHVSRAAVLETSDSSSQCESYIFSLLYKLNSSVFNMLQPIDLCFSDITVVTASKNFRWGPGSPKLDAGVPMKYGTVDTSTNTDETLEREEVDLETLVSCFPEYSKRELEEVMSLYGKDIELVSTYLLEAPAYSDLVEEESVEDRHYLEKQPVNRLKSLAEMCSSIARERNQMDQDDLEMKVILAGKNRLQKIESFSRSRLLSNEKGHCCNSWEDCLVLENFTEISSADEKLYDTSHPLYGVEPSNFKFNGYKEMSASYKAYSDNFNGYKEKSGTSETYSNFKRKDTLTSFSSNTEQFKLSTEDQSAVKERIPQSMPVVPVSFIKALEGMYGPLNSPTGCHDMTLDDLTARKIYNCLKLFSAKKGIVNNTEKQLKDDEALARALQETEDAKIAAESAKRESQSVPGWTNHRPPWMHQGVKDSPSSGDRNMNVRKQSSQHLRTGSVADTLNLLKGTNGRKTKPFKFQKKMPRMAVKSVWSGQKRRNQADSLLSIMEEEKAREELHKEQILNPMRLIELTGDSQALATRLKRMELSNLYPSLGPDFLEEVFMNTSYSMEETVRTLEMAYGISPAPMSKEKQDEILEQMKERSNEEYYRQFVSAEDVYDQYSDQDDVSWSYEDLRHEADMYHNLAKECKDQANRYLGDGMPSAALFYRQKAKDYKEREYNANHKAAEILFEKGRERLSKENTLDLHFYHLDEALIAVNKAITLMEAEYHHKPDKKSTYVNIVTGRGRNSKDGKPILKPAVINHLRDRCFRFEERSPGMLRVYIGQRL